MDAGSLAVVMAPNLVRCDTEKLITLDNSNLRIHTGQLITEKLLLCNLSNQDPIKYDQVS